MSDNELPVEAGGGTPESSRLTAITGWIAVAGGMLALVVAGLVTVSVLGRWLFAAPIDGDFEYVKMATAISVFSFLPYTQARRGNIMVDTFTMGLSAAARARVDAFWDLAYAAIMGFCAYALIHGSWQTFMNGETTMQRQIPLWPSIAIATALCIILTIVAVIGAVRLVSATNKNT